MAVRIDCRHFSARTVSTGDKVEKCRLGANTEAPFACPEHCVFFEPRAGMSAGWTVPDSGDQPG